MAAAKGRGAFLNAKRFQDAADLVLALVALARGTAKISHQLFIWHTDGWRAGFLAERNRRESGQEREIRRPQYR